MKRILGVICILVIAISLGACAACDRDSQMSHTTSEITENTEVTDSEDLPNHTVADALLGKVKTLTVTDNYVTLTTKLGLTETKSLSRTGLSITTTESILFIEVTFRDKTGQTIVINLTSSDYNKVLTWLDAKL